MSVDQVFSTIKELGHINSKRDELRDYCKLKIDQIVKFLPRRILNSDGADLLDCIFNGLPDNPTSSKSKVKIVDIVLQSLRKESTSLTHCGDVISRLCLELSRLPAQDLVRWSNDSIQSIIEDKDVNMIWKDVLPECLSSLSAYNTIQHCGSDITIPEYKEQCVKTLCQCKWKESQLVQLTAMFRDMQLPRNDHKQVVNKICSYVIDVPPDLLPPLVHQLIKLCKTYHVEIVLAYLSHYFSIRLYSKLEPPPANSESTMDLDDIVQHSPAELSRCLSTCIYHVSAGAAEPEVIRRHLKNWPRTQLLRNPFLVDLALALSDKGADFRAVCLDVIRSAIEQRVSDELRRVQCAWSRAVLRPDVSVPDLLKVLTTESTNHRELTVVGLINLAFSLLGVSRIKPVAPACWSYGKLVLARLSKAQPETAPHILSHLADRLATDTKQRQYAGIVLTQRSTNHRELTVVGLINLAFSLLGVSRIKPVAPACWSYGKLVLARLSKAQPETAPHILSHLADRLATDTKQRQYADCLRVLCSLTPVSVERCSQLGSILESCQPSPGDYRSAAAVLEAVHPLLSFSTRARDTLVMVCRKGLYSRDSTHRCLALCGFLCVLRHVSLSRSLSSSQGACSEQYSALSYLTQVTVDVHAQSNTQVTSRVRNEAMCMEVVSILRRCLVQDATVKELLYTRLYECAKEKAILHEAILELLYEHLSKYLPEGDGDGALLIDKCVQVTPVTALLTEPISRLLYATAQFVQPEEEELEDILESQSGETGSAHLRSQLNTTLDKLCAANTLAKINISDDPSLTDLTPESKAKALKVQQLVSCYEALIAHRIMQWSNGDDPATRAYDLFRACSQILEQTKSNSKIGKKGSKSNLNETKETVKTQKSQKSQKEKGKAPVKILNLVKDRAGPFKLLPCVWDLKLCLRILELLYSENVPWSSVEQRNTLRAKRDFHHWVLSRVASSLAGAVDKRQARDISSIAALLYNRAICRLESMCEFDDQTAIACTDLYRDCLALLFSTQFSLKLDSFLPAIVGLETPSACVAAILDEILSAMKHIDEDSDVEERDNMVKKLFVSLIQTAGLIMETPMPASAETSAVVTKFEEYITESKRDCLSLLPALLSASCREELEASTLNRLLLKLTHALGKIDEEESSGNAESPTTFPFIDSASAHTALSHVCAHLNARYQRIEHLLARARDLGSALTHLPTTHQQRVDKELHELYSSIILQLCECSKWAGAIGKLRCAVGSGSDRVLTACVRLYALLASLARHMAPHTAPLVRFERLLKLCGKKLSTVTDNLITYLEASQEQQSANKVLRETKLIPRLVLEAELFSKNVIVLAGKAKINYQQYLSLGTARDFRIKGPVLQEMLQARQHEAHEEDEQVDINDAETEVLSPVADDEEEGSDEETSRRKRRRVS